eukprot:scaffold224_cov108-Skeletonema_marinoi.AAC.27
METKLWAINPGLAVGLAGAGAFVAGMGVHVLTRGTNINTVYSCGETRVFDEQAQRPKYRKGELLKWSFADLPARHEKCTEYPHICLRQGNENDCTL